MNNQDTIQTIIFANKFYLNYKKLKSKILFSALVFFLSVNFVSAQFVVKDDIFSAGGVSNDGKVAGYQGRWDRMLCGCPIREMLLLPLVVLLPEAVLAVNRVLVPMEI